MARDENEENEAKVRGQNWRQEYELVEKERESKQRQRWTLSRANKINEKKEKGREEK